MVTTAEKNRAVKADILAALKSGPKTTPELVTATMREGLELSSRIKMLLKDGEISRVEITKGRFRYYIGTTAPNWRGYVPAVRNLTAARLTSQMEYRVPVRRMAFDADSGRTNRVTLPAAPWEIRA